MKSLFKYLTLSIVLSAFIACGDDDETTPTTAAAAGSITTGTTLEGKWNGFEFKGDDGMVYGLNQMVPYYDSSSVQGCVVYDYRETYLEYSYEFKTDLTGVSIYRSTDESRSYTINNASTCDFSYGTWNSSNYSETTAFTYAKLGTTQLTMQYSGSSSVDTINYTINAGILEFTDGSNIKLKK